MTALLRKLEAEQAAGWPTPPTWALGDMYPDPLLTAYVNDIRTVVMAAKRARRSRTCSTPSATMVGTKSDPATAVTVPDRDQNPRRFQ